MANKEDGATPALDQEAVTKMVANALGSLLPTAIADALKPITTTMQANSLSADDRAALATAAKITADHKIELVTKITANSKVTKEQAEAMDLATLEVFAAGLIVPDANTVDYGGRAFGGNRLTSATKDDKAVKSMVPPTTRQAVINRAAKKDTVN